MLTSDTARPPEAAGGSWTVYSQDDTGNRFVVEEHLNRDEAEQLVKKLEARGHKQYYWAEPKG